MKNLHRDSALTALLLPTAFAEDWPQWGGNDPGRNMYSPAKNMPSSFDPGKLKTRHRGNRHEHDEERELGRQARLAKLRQSSRRQRKDLRRHQQRNSPRQKAHGDRSILMCLDEKTGEFLWQLVVPKLASGKVNDWENLGLFSSPVVEGNRVYIVTSRCEVMCLDTEGMKNGNDGDFKDEAQYIVGPGKAPGRTQPNDADIIWRYDMMDELGVVPAQRFELLHAHRRMICLRLHLERPGLDAREYSLAEFAELHRAQQKDRQARRRKIDAEIGPRIFHGQWCSPSTRQGERQEARLLRRRRRMVLRVRCQAGEER